MTTGPATYRSKILAYALSFPDAFEDHPWGDTVVKTGKKAFVFMGEDRKDGFGFAVKLPRSGEGVLMMPFASPTGYGLGKSGWVSLRFDKGDDVPPLGMLCDWIEESFRAVALKRAIKSLDVDPPARPKTRR